MPKNVDLDRVRTMTRLAIYDKTFGKKDYETEQYYKADYIFKKNASNYLGIIVGVTIVMLIHFFNLIFVSGIFVDQVDYMSIVSDYCILGIIVLVLYTWIGIYVYGREYDEKTKRLKAYYKILDKLNQSSL